MNEDQQIEHAAAEDVPYCDIGEGGQRRRTEAGEQFRQAGGRRKEHHADPAAPETGLFAEHVPYRARRTPAKTMTSAVARNWIQIIVRRLRARGGARRVGNTPPPVPTPASAPPNTTPQSSTGMAAFPSRSDVNGSEAAATWMPTPAMTAACRYVLGSGRIHVCLDG